jgi:hypothetical protein
MSLYEEQKNDFGNYSDGNGDSFSLFPKTDLHAKYLAGGIGTYTKLTGTSKTWTKQ